ncbi:hypothetical protein M8C21_011561, partial [Ambrosia artemisiifolia]
VKDKHDKLKHKDISIDTLFGRSFDVGHDLLFKHAFMGDEVEEDFEMTKQEVTNEEKTLYQEFDKKGGKKQTMMQVMTK